MNRRITLRDAFSAWAQFLAEDLSDAESVKLDAFGTADSYKESTELWKIAWRKAAETAEITWPQHIQVEFYSITIRQNEDDKDKGFILVEVSEPRKEELEGQTLIVTDANGATLLKSPVRDGEAGGRLEDLNSIDLEYISVRPAD